ncbi:MAG: DNA repair protein RadC [Deltaproteobacteria bacterium]|nr:MAG: DNA repair protein RadC [Deltaproteobacteria bacterium]
MQLRERYRAFGPERCSEVELVALSLGTGVRGRSRLAIARALWDRFGSVEALARAEITELASVCGVGPARAVRLQAALQLGRRVRHEATVAITSPEHAAHWLGAPLRGLEDEELHGLFLDRRHTVLAHRVLTRGGPDHTLVDPRQILRTAVRLGAVGIVLAHNHPSGDPEPSHQDREATRRVARAAREVGVKLLDHLVFGDHGYVSLAERGELTAWSEPVAMALR